MKLFFSVLILVFVAQIATAQKTDLLVKSSDKGLFLEHKVQPKESFFAIGRLYNTHPNTIASFNKLDLKKGLVIGQLLRVPLTDTNFTQKGNKGTPVYYKIGENESLEKVSSAYKNVSVDNLRNWNDIPANPRAGTKLIVGFLLSKEMPSVTIADRAKQQEQVVSKNETVPLEIKETQPEVVKPVVKEEPKKAEPVFAKQDNNATSTGDGYFKYHFEQQVKKNPVSKDETATSGIFKTTSGWLDNKYYLLMDGVQPGTIIKVSNPANNKTIYAKVLGEMAGIRQNEGFDIRISSAAASALQITEQDKFIVKVNY
jgi:hypothetical protein